MRNSDGSMRLLFICRVHNFRGSWPAGEEFRDALRVRRRIVEPVWRGRVLAWISARRSSRAGAHPSVVHGVDRIELPTLLADGPRRMQSLVFSMLYPPEAAQGIAHQPSSSSSTGSSPGVTENCTLGVL